MTTSIIPQLVRKDFMIMRKTILLCCLVSLVSIGGLSLLYGNISTLVLLNIGFILLVGPAATCGIVMLMQTNVFEKEKSTQSFIMSLPVTVKEFTWAKLLVNIPVFGAIWIAITTTAFYCVFGLGLFPLGAVPFISMIFLGVFVAYTCILSVSLLFQSMGITVLAILFFEISTSGYLWLIAYFEPIADNIYGPDVVWNSVAVSILTTQVFAAITVILATVLLQNRKGDFI